MRLEAVTLERLRTFFAARPVRKAYLFGSYARGEADAQSDVDIMVELSEPLGLEFVRMGMELEELLHAKVDLVTEKGLNERVRPYARRDMRLIYARQGG